MQKLYSSFIIKVLLLSVIWAVPLQASESRNHSNQRVVNAQGVIESKGKNKIVINGVQYKVGSYARIREGDRPLRLRHLLIGADIEFDYKTSKKNKPVITSISVIMK
jgi:hypothetical protein